MRKEERRKGSRIGKKRTDLSFRLAHLKSLGRRNSHAPPLHLVHFVILLVLPSIFLLMLIYTLTFVIFAAGSRDNNILNPPWFHHPHPPWSARPTTTSHSCPNLRRSNRRTMYTSWCEPAHRIPHMSPSRALRGLGCHKFAQRRWARRGARGRFEREREGGKRRKRSGVVVDFFVFVLKFGFGRGCVCWSFILSSRLIIYVTSQHHIGR